MYKETVGRSFPDRLYMQLAAIATSCIDIRMASNRTIGRKTYSYYRQPKVMTSPGYVLINGTQVFRSEKDRNRYRLSLVKRTIAYEIVTSEVPVIPPVDPPSALNIELRPSGPFWQDAARTIPALATDDWVYWWDDSSPAGNHASAIDNAGRMKRAAGGGIKAGGTDSQLIIPYGPRSGHASVYARRTRANVTGDEFFVQNSSTFETDYLFESGAGVYIKASAVYLTKASSTTADTVVSGVVRGATSFAAIGAVKGTEADLTSFVITSGIRIGAYGATNAYPLTGQLLAVAFAEVGHTDPEWLAMVAYLEGLV